MNEHGKAQNNPAGKLSFVIPLRVTLSIDNHQLTISSPIAVAKQPDPISLPSDSVEKVPVIFPNLDQREGYQRNFLSFDLPLPEITQAGQDVAAKLEDGTFVLKYHRFSLVMHKTRRMAIYTAANVDWRSDSRKVNGRKPSRKKLNGFVGNEREDWTTDPRISLDDQLPDYFYQNDRGAFDRGHLVRRDDVAWGDTFDDMQKGNGDTFHTTNCTPQVGKFNQSSQGDFNWGDLENMIQNQSGVEKVCVFSGPIFSDDDPVFEGFTRRRTEVDIQIPQSYWKIIVADNGGSPQAFGFVLDQSLADVDFRREFTVTGMWKQHMSSIQDIERQLNGVISLEPFKQWDQHGK